MLWKVLEFPLLRKEAGHDFSVICGSPSDDLFEGQVVVVRDCHMLDSTSLDEALGVVDLVFEMPDGNCVLWRLIGFFILCQKVLALLLCLESRCELLHWYSLVSSGCSRLLCSFHGLV